MEGLSESMENLVVSVLAKDTGQECYYMSQLAHLHSVMTQKTTVWAFTTGKTSNFV
jgi:hypothetical protein